MSILEVIWWFLLFVLSFVAGFLTGNFFGENRAEELRYKYLGGELK